MADLSALVTLGYGRSRIMPSPSVLSPNSGVLTEQAKLAWAVAAARGLTGLPAADALRLVEQSVSASLFVNSGPITSVTGTRSHGSALTINSSSAFGTKATAAPLMWETFESGSFHAQWSETPTQATIQTANQRHARSTRNALIDGYGGNDQHWMLDGTPTSQTWFLSFWFKLASDWTWGNDPGSGALGNIKFMRLWGPSDPGDESAIFVIHGSDLGFFWKGAFWDETYFANNPFALNTWHHVEAAFKDSSSTSATDGEVYFWHNGVLLYSKTNGDFRDTNNLKRPLDLGLWNSHDSSPDDSWQDDTYADTSWARAYIAEGSTWATRGASELQPPTAWGASQIVVTCNQGGLSAVSGKYLYVVKDDGTVVNSTGFQL